jgi:glycosyltransferase involved in cell wall biosynthesis
MKYAVQIRSDHASKPGGDTALAKAFAKRLQRAGHETSLIHDVAAMEKSRPDVLLAFNLDQPLELLRQARAAKALGCKVALYALHHPSQGVSAYLRSHLQGVRGAVACSVGSDPEKYFHVMALLRGLRGMNVSALRYLLLGRRRLLRDAANCVDELLVSGPSEAEAIKRALPEFASKPTWNVPHPIDLHSAQLASEPVFPRVAGRSFLIAGRIESRKNQISVLEIASGFPQDQFIFAGLTNETDASYAEAFKEGLQRHPNCHWLGQLDMPRLLRAIADADFVLSPSWFEVMSLISLFAHALGTPVISAAHTYDADLLGPQTPRYLPEIPGDLERALRQLAGDTKPELSADAQRTRADAFTARTWQGFDAWLEHDQAGGRA